MKAYIETYGCALNQADSLVMRGYLEEKGISVVEDPEEADVLIINTCVVRRETEEKMIRRISEIYGRYSGRRRVVVAGCMVSSLPATVRRIAPSAGLVAPNAIDKIVDAVTSPKRVEILRGLRDTSRIPLARARGVVAPVPISEGCLSDCSFCITKISRGLLRSYPPNVVASHVKELVRRGYKEIELTSQDAGAYGFDLEKRFLLPDLLREILKIDGDYMVRIGMINPQWLFKFVDDMLEVLKSPRVYRFLHIPVQSGDNRVLRLMKRGYTVEEFEGLVDEIRAKIPDITIATDIIAGHPGEDEEAFRNTLDLMRRAEFDRVHLAQYSVRPLTESASMPQIPDGVKKKRSTEAQRLQEEIGLRIHRRYVGARSRALVTEKGLRSGTLVARTPSYRPVVIPATVELGTWVDVEIKGATFFDLRGDVVDHS